MYEIKKIGLALMALSGISILFAVTEARAQPRAPHVLWFRTYDNVPGRAATIYDIFANTQGDFTFCGNTGSFIWLTRIDAQGGVEWNQRYGAGTAASLIQTDDGGFAAAGSNQGTMVLKTNGEGEQLWLRSYNGGGASAIIELKAGSLAICGYGAFIHLLTAEGDSIWYRVYDHRVGQEFEAMREVEDGLVLCGTWYRNAYKAYLAKVDFNGDIIWERYPEDEHQPFMWVHDMTSCHGDGFAIIGGSSENENGGRMKVSLLRVDNEGQTIWWRTYDLEGGSAEGWGIKVAADGGFFLGGKCSDGELLIRTDAGGNELWRLVSDFGDELQISTANFRSMVVLPDNSIVAAGWALDRRQIFPVGLVVHYSPDITAPRIVDYSPDSLTFQTLPDDTVNFWVRVEDEQEDSIIYRWRRGGELLSENDSLSICFTDIGNDTIKCVASDGFLADSIAWVVSVRGLFISSYHPDSLNLALRRGTTVDFSLDSVAAVGNEPILYNWNLTDLNRQEHQDISDSSSASVLFRQSDNYSLEAYAYRDTLSDAVTWNIVVRSVVLNFFPGQQTLSVPNDTIIHFEVIPFDPADSLSYTWVMDGDWAGSFPTVEYQFHGDGLHNVTAIVSDSTDADTIVWNVTVVRPDDAEADWKSAPPGIFSLSLSPNPFNSFAVASVHILRSEQADLTLFDLSGRRIARLFQGPLSAGDHEFQVNGSSLPAGIYLLSVKAGNDHSVRKLALVK